MSCFKGMTMTRIKLVGIAAFALIMLITTPLQAQEEAAAESADQDASVRSVQNKEPDIEGLEKKSREA